MRILALETSLREARLALLDGQECLATGVLEAGRSTAKWLIPTIRQLLDERRWVAADVELLAISLGPGSFTGLRLGLATAKSWAFARGCAVVGIETLTAIAAQAAAGGRIVSVMDAQRGELFAACFEVAEGRPRPIRPPQVLSWQELAEWLNPETCVTGPGLIRGREHLPAGATASDQAAWVPRAETVGRLAAARAADGDTDDFWQLTPLYIRPSAAQEKNPR